VSRSLDLRLCVVTSYPPNRARLSEYSKCLIRELSRSQNIDEIHVVADVVGGRKNSVWESPKVQVLRVWRSDDALSILAVIPKIVRLRPDVVHLNLHFQSFGRGRPANFVGISLVRLLRLLGMNVVVTVHNLAEKVDLEKVGVKLNTLNRIGIVLATKILLCANVIVVPVRSYVEHLERVHRCRRTAYIRHGAALRTVERQNMPNSGEKKVLMFGHMAPHKGLPVVLEAFDEMINEGARARLVVAGSDHPNFPGYLERFIRMASPGVEFLGYVPEEDVENLFVSSDVIVLPYLTATGTSGVFHTACSFGKPIVASDLPEIRELVAEGASAVLVQPGDPKALNLAIRGLLDDPDRCLELGRRNLAYASRETWDSIAAEYEHVYGALGKIRTRA